MSYARFILFIYDVFETPFFYSTFM